MQEYYTISTKRLDAIARAARLGPYVTRAILLANWPGGKAHQDRINSAPIAELAAWVADVAADIARKEA